MSKTTVKQYFKDCFQKKVMIRKGIIAAIACALVLIFSLSFYFWLKDKVGETINKNGFWYISVTKNPGIGWSALANKPGAIFAIQSIVAILLIAIFLLLCKDDWTSSFIACAIFGGLFNLFQRAAVADCMVLDYFRFGFWESFPTFNWPDMFVVVGVFGFVISYIVYIVKHNDDEEADDEKSKAKAYDKISKVVHDTEVK